MKSALITLTTDFGWSSPYVAAVKGMILSRAPLASIHDLSHTMPPQDVIHAAYFLREALPWFPAETIHVIVIDPGVGTARAALCITLDGQHLLCPDNGVWTLIPHRRPAQVRLLSNSSLWHNPVSTTFHGRDIFAPCAAALALGVDSGELGEEIADWTRLQLTPCRVLPDKIVGEVTFIDGFGNAITNIPRQMISTDPKFVRVANSRIKQFLPTYGAAQPGEMIALISSGGYLEIAVVNGSAVKRLPNLKRCSKVEVAL